MTEYIPTLVIAGNRQEYIKYVHDHGLTLRHTHTLYVTREDHLYGFQKAFVVRTGLWQHSPLANSSKLMKLEASTIDWNTCTHPILMLVALGDAADEPSCKLLVDAFAFTNCMRLNYAALINRYLSWKAVAIYWCSGRNLPDNVCDLIRCLWPNPFDLTRRCIEPRWRTSLALNLARKIKEESSPELSLILADVLEEAGCDNCEIGYHLRCKIHVSKCWVIDLLLNGEANAKD